MKCAKHRRYTGKGKPRSACSSCWWIYFLRHGTPGAWRKRAEKAEAREQEMVEALKVECTCRVIEKCERCEAIDKLAEIPHD